MSWEEQPIEKKLKEKLASQMIASRADELMSYYITARTELILNVYPEIKKAEPNLSYHDASHIANVLENIDKLVGDELENVTALELYTICLSALFHDVGNIESRTKHQEKVTEVYDFVRKNGSKFHDEKLLIMQVAGAHCGDAIDGTKDTLKFLEDMHIFGESIRARKVAAVLRLADELAEGLQRTSEYFIEKGRYPDENLIFHKYAQMCSVCVDKGSSRIAVNYNIPLIVDDDQVVFDPKVNLNLMLDFVYYRIVKLDQERRYCKHYCDWLNKFKETSAQLRFWLNSMMVFTGLRPLTISDLIVPGDNTNKVTDYDPEYDITNIMTILRSNAFPGVV